MPKLHIFKESRRNSKQTRESVEAPKMSVQEKHQEEMPPPKYTECPPKSDTGDVPPNSNITYSILTRKAGQERDLRRSRLLLFLMEILAVTFFTDCRKFKETQKKLDPTWRICDKDSSSILNVETRGALTELSTLIQNLQKEMNHGRWLLIPGRERKLITKSLLEPIEDENLNLDYVLEVISRYKRMEGCHRPESTLVDDSMQSSFSTDLADTIASHALLLQSLRLETELHLILEDSITTYQNENGLQELRTSEELQEESMLSLAETCCWPLSEGNINLARGLRGLQKSDKRRDPFGLSRTRLREARKLREH
jgi:hypothetical protein